MELILASKSPRRRELLGLITPRFTVQVADVNERLVQNTGPAHLAGQLALKKGAAIAAQNPQAAVIGCDTVVEQYGLALGKPVGEAECIRMLTALSGRAHSVHTGVALFLPGAAGRPVSFVETTAVHFSDIPAGEIEAYAKTFEPYDKAGGYGIQGWAARFIPRVEGCYYNVMGLPVAALYTVLRTHCPEVLPKDE